MITNLLNGAHVANKLFSTIARLRFLLVMFLTLTVTTNAWGATGNHTCSGTEGIIVSSKITFTTTSATWNSPQCRIAANGSITFTLTGVSVTKIVMGFSSTGYVGEWTSSGGGSFTTNSTNVTWSGSANPGTLTFTTSSAARLKTISVTYETAAASCDKKVTVNKGTPSNGSFSISKTGTYETCDAPLVITLSNITPSAGYQFGAITQTGIGTGVTIDQANKTVTYAKNTSGESTINVTFEQKQSATITLSEAGVETGVTGKYVGDSYTLPSTTSQSCGDLEFVGWSTVEIDNSAEKPTSNFHEPGASVTLAANQTFYAVFATSSGNGSGYTKLNWGATISAGKYLISTGNYTISGRSGNKTSELAVVEYSPTSNEAKTEYEVKIEKIGDYFSIKLPDDTWWVGWNTSTSTKLTDTSPNNDTDYLWQYTENGIQNISAGTRYLQVNYANSAAKVYTTTNTNTWHATYLYAQATSYTDYTTQCTTQPSHTVTSTLSHVTADAENPESVLKSAEDLSLSYSAESGWNLPATISVTMGGAPLSSETDYDWDNGDLLIAPASGFTGDIVVTINGWQQLAKPTGLNVTNITSTSATLSWDEVANASSYLVTIVDGGDLSADIPNTQTSHTFEGLTPSTEYLWTVTAIGDGINYTNSEESETGDFTTLKVCEKLGAATDLAVVTNYVQDGQTYVKFSWTPAAPSKEGTTQKLCYGLVGQEKTCTVSAKHLGEAKGVASSLPAGEYEWSIQALGDGINYCDGDVVEGTNFYIYSITYNTNGGDAIPAASGTALPNPLPIPTKEHYEFQGWFTDEDCTQAATAGTTINADIILYAKWEAVTYTITLVPNYPNSLTGVFKDKEGNVIADNLVIPIKYGTEPQPLTDFYSTLSLDGYQFDAFYTKVEDGHRRVTTGNLAEDLILYARWKQEYTITWNVLGAETGTTTIVEGQEWTLPEVDESCSGKQFVGWTTTPILEEQDEAPATLYTETNQFPLETNTYYAVFANVEVTGTGEYVKVTKDLADYSGEYLIVYEAGNKAFNGGLGESSLDKNDNYISITISDDVVQATDEVENARFIVAKVDGGYSIQSASGLYIGRDANSNGTDFDQTYNENLVNTFPNCSTIRGKGGADIHYNNSSQPSQQNRFRYYNSANVQPIALYKKTGTNMTNYTTSCVPTYTITWKNEDGTVLETDKVEEDATPTYDGATPTKTATAQYTYTFDGWTPDIVKATEDATYTATYTATVNKYTITWKNGETTLETDNNVPYGEKPTYDGETPTKAATAQYTYTFNGWSPEVTNVTGDAIYSATFSETVNKYQVTFNMNGHGDEITAQTVDYGSTAAEPSPAPTADGYEFAGWYKDEACTEAYDFSSTITGDLPLYAKWLNIYTITWKANGLEYETTKVTEGDPIIPPSSPDLGDYCGQVFAGWTDAEMAETSDAAPTLYPTPTPFPTASEEAPKIFYAVFADYDEQQ